MRKDLITPKVFKEAVLIPYYMYKIKNWQVFISNLLRIKSFNNDKIIKFRNGLRIQTKEQVDCSTIKVVFFHKDYGEIKKKRTIIDIGANIGSFSLYAAKSDKSAHIYSYEPISSNYNLLLKNINLNGFEKRIKTFKMAVAAKKGKRNIYVGKESPFNSFFKNKYKSENYETVSTVTMKDIFESNKIDYCNLLKIDCEGAEYEILFNTPDKYLNKIEEIRMEYHLALEDNNLKKIKKFLTTKDFAITKIKKDNNNSGIIWFKKKR